MDWNAVTQTTILNPHWDSSGSGSNKSPLTRVESDPGSLIISVLFEQKFNTKKCFSETFFCKKNEFLNIFGASIRIRILLASPDPSILLLSIKIPIIRSFKLLERIRIQRLKVGLPIYGTKPSFDNNKI